MSLNDMQKTVLEEYNNGQFSHLKEMEVQQISHLLVFIPDMLLMHILETLDDPDPSVGIIEACHGAMHRIMQAALHHHMNDQPVPEDIR